MKFKTNKLSLNLVLASSLLAASIPAFAVTGDTDQPIHIESDQQSLDMQGNVVTFTGNVIAEPGALHLLAGVRVAHALFRTGSAQTVLLHVSGVTSLGLKIIALPAASAGADFHKAIWIG